MSEGAAGGTASQGAPTGQPAGNAEGQSVGSQAQATATPAGESGKQAGGETAAESFEKAETQTVAEHAETEEPADDYVPIRDYIRQQYKDEQFDDDDKVDRKAFRHIKDLETYRERNRDANKKVMTLFAAHPELVGALQDMDAGADFAEALALNLSPEQRKVMRETILADDYKPQKETWQQKKTEREAKFTERQKWSESYAENRKQSANNLKEFAEENKLDQAGVEEFAKYADEILANVYNGRVDKAFLNALHKARVADKQIADAAKVAEVRGRNAAISEKATKEEPQGDGLPDLAKGGETREKPKMSEGQAMITDLVDGFNKRTKKFE